MNSLYDGGDTVNWVAKLMILAGSVVALLIGIARDDRTEPLTASLRVWLNTCLVACVVRTPPDPRSLPSVYGGEGGPVCTVYMRGGLKGAQHQWNATPFFAVLNRYAF